MKPTNWDDEDAVINFEPADHDGGVSANSAMGNGIDRQKALMAAEALAKDGKDGLDFLTDIAKLAENYDPAGGPVILSLRDISEAGRALITQVMGEGEVTMEVAGSPHIKAVEAVTPGIWRVMAYDKDLTVLSDHVEIAEVPSCILEAAEHGDLALEVVEPPEGCMNVKPVLAEIRDRAMRYQAGEENHIISFTLLPMNEMDVDHLRATLGEGAITVISRGYGACKVLSTRIKNVWAVQFFNSMEKIVLDTVEIGTVPAAARADAEDVQDSGTRLQEIVEAYF